MKRLTGIWRSALIMTLAMALIVVLFLLGILGYMVLTFKLNVDANFSTNTIDEALVQTADGYEFSAAYALDGKNQWAMLIDDNGDVIWSYHKPAEIPDHYTMRDVAAFTRWFIDDYPVRTRIRDDGLLVIGAPGIQPAALQRRDPDQHHHADAVLVQRAFSRHAHLRARRFGAAAASLVPQGSVARRRCPR